MDGYDYSVPDGADIEYLNAATVYSSMINRYFVPKEYKEYGFMTFIAVTEQEYNL